ncbi:small-conductance mechanosensitive channel [Pseudomonas sp. 478]|uniref:mechanosensitive ion channel family protein n=1 Tax=unclassified Pseudomonas TaxID=196821 RepID=UPI000DACB4FA|nr:MULTISPECIES: mechanosensitive ion channel domain-containing protein [unclassified Pseudomonas]PZW93812.1 small-conductance mechanosensitive channel [Pseudomonas sp. 478]TCV50124.1 small-conductance mechanosensitive channel [Pseudomonas sp. 460]
MFKLKTAILLGALLILGSNELEAAALPGVPAAATATTPLAHPEPLVQGGLLGAISSSIDQVQGKLDLNEDLLDAWRLRADRAAVEVDQLVNHPSSRSSWSVAGDFLLLSGVWIGVFALLWLLGGLLAKRLCQNRLLLTRERGQALLGYVLPYTVPALISLPLTLYVSHFLQVSAGRALALCFAYATSSGIFAASLLLSLVVLFNAGHKRRAVQIIRQYSPRPLFLMGFLVALSDGLTSPQIARLLGGNLTSSVAVFTGVAASVTFGILVIKMRRPVAHLISILPLAQRLSQPALREMLRIFSGLWYWPILLMVLVSVINLIGIGDDNQKVLRCALFTTVLLIAMVFLSTSLHHLFKSRSELAVRRSSAYKERFISLSHALLRIALAIVFIDVLGRIWGVSLFEFAVSNAVGRAISDSLSRIGLIFLVTWMVWVVLDTAIQEALKPPVSKRSARQPSTRVKTILPLLRNAIKIVLVVICAITTMANLGINVAPFLAGAGVVGLAIGFGSQQLVQDVITGLFIIIEDTLSIGDWVVLDSGHAGTVEGLTIRTLRLRDGKGFVHSVPFGQIKAVTNQSRQFAYAFFSVQFTYDTDVDKAIELIREAGDSIRDDAFLKYNLQGSLDVFGVDKMDLNGVVLTAQFRTVSGGQYAVSRAFNQRLKKLVDNSPWVHFAQTYPQQVLMPRQAVEPLQNDGLASEHSTVFLPDQPRTQ